MSKRCSFHTPVTTQGCPKGTISKSSFLRVFCYIFGPVVPLWYPYGTLMVPSFGRNCLIGCWCVSSFSYAFCGCFLCFSVNELKKKSLFQCPHNWPQKRAIWSHGPCFSIKTRFFSMFSAKKSVEIALLRGKRAFLWCLWYPYGSLVAPKMHKNAKNAAKRAISWSKIALLPAFFAFLLPYGTLKVP